DGAATHTHAPTATRAADAVSTPAAPIFFFKQQTAYEMVGSDWSSDVCSSDLVQRDVTPVPRPASADSYPATDSRRPQCSPRSSRTRGGPASIRRGPSNGSPAVSEPATQPRNPLRVMPISQPTGDQPVQGPGGVVELLIRGVAVARL